MNIFIFHRDFRLDDNVGLYHLSQEENEIYLLFIFTKDQVKNNPYFSPRSFEVLIHCLKELNKNIPINFIKAENELNAIETLLKEGHKINKIYTNRDYTPYAVNRSYKLSQLAKENNFIYKEFHDYSLITPEMLKTVSHSYYTVFTPFWNKLVLTFQDTIISTHQIRPFQAKIFKSKMQINIETMKSNHYNLPLTALAVQNVISKLNQDYANNRNLVFLENSTTKISTALKFGVVSIRQCYQWGKKQFNNFANPFNRQLAWREFFYQVTYNAQLHQQWKFGTNWNRSLNINWINNAQYFEKWKNGETGYDFIDAGMKELNETGFIHNRARMVCASFLVKNLQIDWKIGEQYFAQKLIDYDPIINQCSWQWVAGTGFDAQPYFRVFNPELQQKKFDPEKIYINKYLPKRTAIEKIVDYKESVKKALEIYKIK